MSSSNGHAFVTGAGSGIGAAVATRLAEEGLAVTAADVNIGGARRTAEQSPSIMPVALDVSDAGQVETVVAAADQRASITILVNVAGIGSVTSVPQTTLDVWNSVMSVNMTGIFLTCRAVIPLMVARGSGAIVNVASIAGLVGLRNRAAYCASKGGVIALTKAMALDHVADGLRINAVCPGTISSPWVARLVADVGESIDALAARQPMGRLGTPEEVAEAVLFLASDRSSFATGSVLVLDGGLTAA
jgi:NAD(P)-dependent dehydrogenase (short-subunit alcohol dehydrogenase family)